MTYSLKAKNDAMHGLTPRQICSIVLECELPVVVSGGRRVLRER
jgi:hypothetical protein